MVDSNETGTGLYMIVSQASHTGNDSLDGGDGNDILFGNQGLDILNGGSGDDVMTAGSLADLFFFSSGADVITDTSFDDTVQLDASLWSGDLSAQEVVDQFGEVTEAGVLLDFGDGNSLQLDNVTDIEALALQIEI